MHLVGETPDTLASQVKRLQSEGFKFYLSAVAKCEISPSRTWLTILRGMPVFLLSKTGHRELLTGEIKHIAQWTIQI